MPLLSEKARENAQRENENQSPEYMKLIYGRDGIEIQRQKGFKTGGTKAQ